MEVVLAYGALFVLSIVYMALYMRFESLHHRIFTETFVWLGILVFLFDLWEHDFFSRLTEPSYVHLIRASATTLFVVLLGAGFGVGTAAKRFLRV